jgi:hypothetical protein
MAFTIEDFWISTNADLEGQTRRRLFVFYRVDYRSALRIYPIRCEYSFDSVDVLRLTIWFHPHRAVGCGILRISTSAVDPKTRSRLRAPTLIRRSAGDEAGRRGRSLRKNAYGMAVGDDPSRLAPAV